MLSGRPNAPVGRSEATAVPGLSDVPDRTAWTDELSPAGMASGAACAGLDAFGRVPAAIAGGDAAQFSVATEPGMGTSIGRAVAEMFGGIGLYWGTSFTFGGCSDCTSGVLSDSGEPSDRWGRACSRHSSCALRAFRKHSSRWAGSSLALAQMLSARCAAWKQEFSAVILLFSGSA